MIEDVYEPLARYRDEFRTKFATLTREKFKELTERSGVDVRANRALVAEINKLQREADSASAKKTCYGCLMAVGFVGAVAALIGAIASNGPNKQTQGLCILGIIAGLVLGIAMIPLYNAVVELLSSLESKIDMKKRTACIKLLSREVNQAVIMFL